MIMDYTCHVKPCVMMVLTLEVLIVVDLLHKVVDLESFGRGDIRRWLFSLLDEFFKEGINFTIEGLPVESSLHNR